MADKKTGKKYKYYKGSFVVGKKPDGMPDRIYVRGKTKAERDDKLAEAKRIHARGLMLGDMTVREWSERWMSVYKANASKEQQKHYEAKLNLDILPTIGNMRIRDVRASHLQEILNSYSGGRRGTVAKIRIAIKQLFADAVAEGVIERDSAYRLELPEMTIAPRRPLTPAEREAVLKVSATHPRGPYVLTMLYCGVRVGECVALVRSDVDLTRKCLSITKAVRFYGNKGQLLPGTKSSKLRKNVRGDDDDFGARMIPIPDLLIPVMASLCNGKDGNTLLFAKSDGTLASLRTVDWWWESFVRHCHIEAGAKLYRNAVQYDTSPFSTEITPHYFRHTYATDLYAAGVDERARKEFLGHVSTDVTDGYTKMSDSAFNRNLNLINEYLNSEAWGKNGANEKK